MYTIRRSSNLGIRPTSSPSASKKHPSNLGTTSKAVQGRKAHTTESMESLSFGSNKNALISESYQMPTSMGPGSNVSSNPVTIDMEPLLTGMTPQLESSLYRLYRDIYYFDSVCGSAVDLISQVTFNGGFNLGGVQSPKFAKSYEEAIERLNVKTLLPEVSVDHLVLGAHCSSLLYNKKKRVFADLMCHPIETLNIEELPFYSQDPIINATFPESTRAAVNSNSKAYKNLKEIVGEEVLSKIAKGSLELDPLTTIFIPRSTFSFAGKGTSYFRRILPIYLIEKNLFRGTLVESARRQRGILHLTVGDGDDWIPQVADLEFMTDLFMNADSDPLGAIIATRSGVSVEEIRQGGDFWKVTDFSDSVLAYKLRALGISEAFLSGEANYNVADSSMTIFIEMLRSYRDSITRKFFYDKLFPLISMVNGYAVNQKGKAIIREELKNVSSMGEAMNILNDGSRLLIPTVEWTKQLKPEGDQSYMEMLDQLTQKGVPVPLRVLAAAGGLSLDELLRQKDDDLAARKSIAEYMAKIAELQPKSSEGEMEASAAIPSLKSVSGASSVLHRRAGRSIPLLLRDFNDTELYGRTKTGKRKSLVESVQASRNHKINRNIVKAMRNADKGRRRVERTTFV
jgi:hypothetical protein